VKVFCEPTAFSSEIYMTTPGIVLPHDDVLFKKLINFVCDDYMEVFIFRKIMNDFEIFSCEATAQLIWNKVEALRSSPLSNSRLSVGKAAVQVSKFAFIFFLLCSTMA